MNGLNIISLCMHTFDRVLTMNNKSLFFCIVRMFLSSPVCAFPSVCFLLLFVSPSFAQPAPDSLKVPSKTLGEVIISSGEKSRNRRDSPVTVHTISSRSMTSVQACNLSDAFRFSPGLRTETNCQTCNYTQLRMNGLQGGYAQILVNGRPLLSALLGQYGLEQIPINLIEQVEVSRGSGSSLSGPSAIGGTVNLITRFPMKNNAEVHTFFQHTGSNTNDINTSANASLVNKENTAGLMVYLNKRNRHWFDANADGFSELPMLALNSAGFTSFRRFGETQRLEVSASVIDEYRLGGQMQKKSPEFLEQAEERKHRIYMGSAEFRQNFNHNQSMWMAYGSVQYINRTHYTGVFPDSASAIASHLSNPPYGATVSGASQAGLRLMHKFPDFLLGKNVITIGSEFISEHVLDHIPAYDYSVNQLTTNWGSYLQSEWHMGNHFTLLSGLRADKHNLLQRLVLCPRLALSYEISDNTLFRMSYGTGFRAPQAFDSDLHTAIAGGGVSRIRLSPSLTNEFSQSFSLSLNSDYSVKNGLIGFSLEGFYTELQRAFFLAHLGQDANGNIFEKQNGSGARVSGFSLELRGVFKNIIEGNAGFTLQQSVFDNPIEYLLGLSPTRTFLRTPNAYGFYSITFTPVKKWMLSLNGVYTGGMLLAHLGGADQSTSDRMVSTRDFLELSGKISRTISCKGWQTELYAGIRNWSNAYQSDFDKGKNRDSNYIYGPGMPRTVYLGCKIQIRNNEKD